MDVVSARRRRRDALAGLTLGAVLGDENQISTATRPQVNRTLLDIIREEEPNSRAYKNLVAHQHNKSWKSFKDRLKLKKSGAFDIRSSVSPSFVSNGGFGQLSRNHSVRVAESGGDGDDDERGNDAGEVHLLNRSLSRVVSLQTDLTQEDTLHIEQVPVSDVPVMNSRSSMLRRNSSRILSGGEVDEGSRSVKLSEALAAEREQIQRVVSSTEAAGRARVREVYEQGEEVETEVGNEDEERRQQEERTEDGQQQEVKMSLMDLLGETDGQAGWSGDEYESDEEEEEDGEQVGSNLVERNCCVCMVRHKGSAFIPCGHTFCRLCSRELWVSRGNCPLCNGFILEILDIF